MSDFSDIEALARSGKKIQAIKEFRNRTRAGLKEAKEAVEWYQAHGHWPAQYQAQSAPSPSSSPPSDDRLRSVEQLVQSNRIIHAIKELRALIGWGLKDTKQAVDRYRAQRAWPANVLAALGSAAPSATPASATATAASGPQAELERLMAGGQKIMAVKRMRELTGWGLRQSKEAVDHYQAHGTWPGDALAHMGGGHAPASSASSSATSTDPIAEQLGHAPDVLLDAAAQHEGRPGRLVVLRDRLCFLRTERGASTLGLTLPHDLMTDASVRLGATSVLVVRHSEHEQEFEMDAADADSAIALLRVFAR